MYIVYNIMYTDIHIKHKIIKNKITKKQNNK